MKNTLSLSLFLFLLLFSSNVFSQNHAAEKRPQQAYLLSGGDSRTAISRPRYIDAENNVAAGKSKKDFKLEKRVFDLINDQRAENGLARLNWSDEVAEIARHHSENMANFKFFSHTDLDGLMVNDRADALGIKKWRAIGENIAFNRGYKNPAESAVERWMQSASHRENLLSNRWRESGIGIAVTEDGTYYFTEVFLLRK
jgi:uncharacterized protein YkwD